MVDKKCYETLNFNQLPKSSLWYSAFLPLFISLVFQSLLGLLYGPNANQVKRRLSHGSVFNFQIPAFEVDSKADSADEEAHSTGENKIQGRSMSVPQVGRRSSMPSQKSHGSHPATPSCMQSSKWANTDDCNGMISVMGGGHGKVHGLEDTAPSEGVMLPPVMEDLGKSDLVRKNAILSIHFILWFPHIIFFGGLLVLAL